MDWFMRPILPLKIREVNIFIKGDRSVGIWDYNETFPLEIDLTSYNSEEETWEIIEAVRTKLKELIEITQGEIPTVSFDFEIKDAIEKETQMLKHIWNNEID